MVAKWQQWMPFYIDAFMGSPAVQAMHPTARIGYLCLLARAWQTEDCTIPADDEITLSDMSGIGDELWKTHRDRILKKFDPVEGTTRLRNAVQYEKWKDAKRIYDRRREAAEKTNTERSPSQSTERRANRITEESTPITERTPLRSADTGTRTRTVTGTETGEVLKAPPTVTDYDFNADPAETIPDGLAPTQYAEFIFGELHIAAGHSLRIRTGSVIGLLASEETCGMPEATKRLLARMRAAAEAGPVKWLLWLEDGHWKQTPAFSIGIEDEQ